MFDDRDLGRFGVSWGRSALLPGQRAASRRRRSDLRHRRCFADVLATACCTPGNMTF